MVHVSVISRFSATRVLERPIEGKNTRHFQPELNRTADTDGWSRETSRRESAYLGVAGAARELQVTQFPGFPWVPPDKTKSTPMAQYGQHRRVVFDILQELKLLLLLPGETKSKVLPTAEMQYSLVKACTDIGRTIYVKNEVEPSRHKVVHRGLHAILDSLGKRPLACISDREWLMVTSIVRGLELGLPQVAGKPLHELPKNAELIQKINVVLGQKTAGQPRFSLLPETIRRSADGTVRCVIKTESSGRFRVLYRPESDNTCLRFQIESLDRPIPIILGLVDPERPTLTMPRFAYAVFNNRFYGVPLQDQQSDPCRTLASKNQFLQGKDAQEEQVLLGQLRAFAAAFANQLKQA